MPTLQFKGKTFVQYHHLAMKYHQLVLKAMPKFKGEQRLVFAPAKYVNDETCRDNRIDFGNCCI